MPEKKKKHFDLEEEDRQLIEEAEEIERLFVCNDTDVHNDNTTTIQVNEVTELNNATVYFTGQDQKGNFRVGDKFLVDLENERTSFDIESIFATNSQVQIRNGNDTVTLNQGVVALDNIVVQGNVIEATKTRNELWRLSVKLSRRELSYASFS